MHAPAWSCPWPGRVLISRSTGTAQPLPPPEFPADTGMETLKLDDPPELEFEKRLRRATTRQGVILHSGSRPARPTPAPWCKVLANPDFRVLIGSGGSQCTWAGHKQRKSDNTLVNDPVAESSGEILYLRDEKPVRSGHQRRDRRL